MLGGWEIGELSGIVDKWIWSLCKKVLTIIKI